MLRVQLRRAVATIDWQLLKKVLQLWFAVFVLAVVADHNRWVLTRPGLVESCSWLVLLSLLAVVPAIAAFLNRLGRAHAVLVSGVVGALLFGQLMGSEPERAYPLVMWRMFSGDIRRLQPFAYFSYVGETQDGRAFELSPPRLFPPLKNQVLTIALNGLVEEAGATAQRGKLDAALAAVGRVHNTEHPERRIARVGVERCRFVPDERATVGCERVFTAEVTETRPR